MIEDYFEEEKNLANLAKYYSGDLALDKGSDHDDQEEEEEEEEE